MISGSFFEPAFRIRFAQVLPLGVKNFVVEFVILVVQVKIPKTTCTQLFVYALFRLWSHTIRLSKLRIIL